MEGGHHHSLMYRKLRQFKHSINCNSFFILRNHRIAVYKLQMVPLHPVVSFILNRLHSSIKEIECNFIDVFCFIPLGLKLLCMNTTCVQTWSACRECQEVSRTQSTLAALTATGFSHACGLLKKPCNML